MVGMLTAATLDTRLNVDYARVSDDDRGAAEGVSSQHEDNTEFSEQVGRPLGATYQDNDISAYSGRERPEYERLLADVARGMIACVFIWHADRLTREVKEGLRIIDLFREHKVRLFSVQKGGEYLLERASGRAELIDDINTAQKESGHKGERITLARKRQARKGHYGGGIRRYGWGAPTGRVRSKCINPKAPLEEREYIDVPVLDMGKHREDEAEEIQFWAEECFATNGNLNQLLEGMRRRGVLTVSEKDGRILRWNGQEVEHHGWTTKTVRNILTSPRTSGHAVYKGEIIAWNVWPAILPEETRQALIVMFDDPGRRKSPGNTPKWLISKNGKCGQCTRNGVVTVRYNSKGPVYRCNVCHKGNQLAELVDEYVAAVACERLARPDLVELVTPPRPEVDVAGLREEMRGLRTRTQKAAQAYGRGSIDLSMMETIKAETDREIKKIRGLLAKAVRSSPLTDFLEADTFESVVKVWKTLSIGRRREIVQLLMDIVVLKGDTYTLDPNTLLITPKSAHARISPAGASDVAAPSPPGGA